MTGDERVAIIGASGEGKSVLLSCILGLLRPNAGEVRLLGMPVQGRPVAVEGLGVAFQSPGLIEAWDVGANLRGASHTPLDDALLHELLTRFGLSDIPLHSSTTQLSGGQKKRVSLLRALLRGTRLVILDEPLSGLDPATAAVVVDQLRSEFRERSRAVLVVTHHYELAAELCDRILLLKDGKLTDVTPSGSVEERLERLGTIPTEQSAKAETVVAREKPLPWGIVPQITEFLTRGMPISVGALALLGALLVVQSAGISPIDVSRYVPKAVTFAVFREISPLVVGLLLASRIGARVSAEIAGMSYTAQLDSMRVMGLSPIRRLLAPFAVSSSITFPLLILAGAVAAVIAGSLAAGMPGSGVHIGLRRFLYIAAEAISPGLVLSCLFKGLVMGTVVATLAYGLSSRRVESAQALGAAVTRASAASAFAVVIVDIAGSWLFFV